MGVCRPIQPGTGYGYPLQAILRLHGREPGRCGWYCLVRVGQVGLGERWRSRTKSPDEGDGVLTASSVGCVVGEGEGSDRRLRREQQLVPDVDPDTEEEETMWLEAARRPRNNGEQWHNWGGPQAREDQRGPVEGGKMGEKQTEQPESRREDLPWANWRDIVPWPASRRAIAPGLTQGRRGPGSGWHGPEHGPKHGSRVGHGAFRHGVPLIHRPMAPGKRRDAWLRVPAGRHGGRDGHGRRAGRCLWRNPPIVSGLGQPEQA